MLWNANEKDTKYGGTNSDGTISEQYCSYCYQNGEFTFNGTVEEMQEFCKPKQNDRTRNPKICSMVFIKRDETIGLLKINNKSK